MIIHQIVIISLLVFAIHYTMLPGEIFGFVEKWWKKMEDELLERADWLMNRVKEINKNSYHDKYDAALSDEYAKEADELFKKQTILEKISQPLFRCPVCMAGIWGTVIYWAIWGLWLNTATWQEWIVCNIGAIGFNSITVRIFKDD